MNETLESLQRKGETRNQRTTRFNSLIVIKMIYVYHKIIYVFHLFVFFFTLDTITVNYRGRP